MKCYSLVIEKRLVEKIDELVKEHGMYSSRSDFIRDAIRQRLIELKKLFEEQALELEQQEPDEEEEEGQAEAVEEAMEEFKYRGVH